MKKITFLISMMITSLAFANVDLNFKSTGLNKITEELKNYSPELVKTGEVESGSCGTYRASFVMQNMTAAEISEKYILNVTTAHQFRNLDFTALELSEEQQLKLSNSVYRITDYDEQDELQYTHAEVYTKKPSGVIFSYTSVYTSVIVDLKTNEFLLFSGDTQQDDCD